MGKIRHYAYSVLLVLLISCAGREEPADRVLYIREMGDLATTEYTVTKIVKANDNKTWYKPGDRKILISVEAVLKSGIDLTSVKKEDIKIDGKNISLRLPPPKLISINIPPEKIKVEFEEIGIFRTGFDNAERDALLAQAEQQIRNSINEIGILRTTENNTRQFLTRFLQQSGFEQISISFDKDSPAKQNLR
ncbi:DUF4230 domain-containing protein [Flavihumibacter stibioxidans]|uniref:DUF4230 domain-containing protein n=1 Tax=Flavihumibacter stibioxidans TaxID=1834163 RepID=A0ABR7M6I1_9BACT|nr:DUF4230 domain-containing protein [Flavihumibacter stibioxidans]MBC6490134.1 hypothetical protein [Flavihumibacter stibioxidans]